MAAGGSGGIDFAAFAEALVVGDRPSAETLLRRAVYRHGSRAGVIAELIEPAMYLVGHRWQTGLIGVADEHRASNLLRMLDSLLPPTPLEIRVAAGSRCLLATLEGERHDLGLRLVAMAMEDAGWEVDLLGADLPVSELVRVALDLAPHMVGLSFALPEVAGGPEARRAVDELVGQEIPVVVGGFAFRAAPELLDRLGPVSYVPNAGVLAPRVSEFGRVY